jgi:hypothetical protein
MSLFLEFRIMSRLSLDFQKGLLRNRIEVLCVERSSIAGISWKLVIKTESQL